MFSELEFFAWIPGGTVEQRGAVGIVEDRTWPIETPAITNLRWRARLVR
jgi:hypothetical protein